MTGEGLTLHKKDRLFQSLSFGAASQIRTGDLVLTKDALCLLSYSSESAFLLYPRQPVLSSVIFRFLQFFVAACTGLIALEPQNCYSIENERMD